MPSKPPAGAPAKRTNAKGATQTAKGAAGRTAPKPGKEAGRPTAKAAGKPAGKAVGKPASKAVGTPTSKPASKAVGKPASKPASKAGGPWPSERRRPHLPDRASLPGHHKTKAEHKRELDEAELDHQDPSIIPGAIQGSTRSMPAQGNPRLDQGAIRTRGIPRMNPQVNWYRKAPKRAETR